MSSDLRDMVVRGWVHQRLGMAVGRRDAAVFALVGQPDRGGVAMIFDHPIRIQYRGIVHRTLIERGCRGDGDTDPMCWDFNMYWSQPWRRDGLWGFSR